MKMLREIAIVIMIEIVAANIDVTGMQLPSATLDFDTILLDTVVPIPAAFQPKLNDGRVCFTIGPSFADEAVYVGDTTSTRQSESDVTNEVFLRTTTPEDASDSPKMITLRYPNSEYKQAVEEPFNEHDVNIIFPVDGEQPNVTDTIKIHVQTLRLK